MAERRFTDAEVIAAGEQLLAGRRKVNGWALRTTLGGGGPKRFLASGSATTLGYRVAPYLPGCFQKEATAIIEAAVA